MTRGGEEIFFHRLQVWFGINLSRLIINISTHELVFHSVSSCNKSLLQKGIICLNLGRIWYIFPTRTFVLNAVKEPGIFLGVGAR